MLSKLLLLNFLFSFSVHQVKAQAGTINVSPLLSCTITTFSCPGVSGCCTIGGCCGSGCCANGYTCINEGTSSEACCPASDPTKCGTAASPSSSPSGHTCTGVEACPALTEDGVGWTCVLGKTCGLSYGECNPCPYIGGGGSSSATSSLSESSPSTTASSRSSPSSSASPESNPTTSISPESSPSSSTSSGSSPSSSSSSGSGSSSGGGSSTSSGSRSREGGVRLHWLAAIGLGGVFGIAVWCI